MRNEAKHTKQEAAAPAKGGSRLLRRSMKAIAWVAGIWISILAIIQVAVSPSVLTKVVNKVATEYIDGTLAFGKVRLSMFRHFPNVGISLEDCSITYPAERFDTLKAKGAQGKLLHMGCGQSVDTLASFRHFSAGINIGALLAGKISIPHLILSEPRIFAHRYDEKNANWNIFLAESDSSESSLPPLAIGKVRLIHHPRIIFTDSQDTLFAMLDVKRIAFDGRVDLEKNSRSKVSLSIDSLMLGGRIAADTLGFSLDRLHIQEEDKVMEIKASSNTTLATRTFGRMSIPVNISGKASFPKDTVPALAVNGMNIEIASIPINLEGTLRRSSGQMHVDGRFDINGCKVDDILKGYIRNIIPETGKVRTDALISMNGTCKGTIGNGTLPAIEANLEIPTSRIGHSSLEKDVEVVLCVSALTDSTDKVNISIDDFKAKAYGLDLSIQAGANDVTGHDPVISINGNLSADLPSLAELFPVPKDIKAEGQVNARIKGSMKRSQLDIYNFAKAAIEGSIGSDGFFFESPQDSISISVKGLDIKAGPESRVSRRNAATTLDFLTISGKIDSTDISYGASMSLKGQSIEFNARNSAEAFSERDTTKIYPLGGQLSAGRLSVKDAEGMSVSLENTSNSFLMMPKREHPEIPVLSITNTNKKIIVRDPDNRFILTDASIKGKAAMNTVERRARRKEMLDSLAGLYPQVERDSLLRYHIRQRRNAGIPEWMTEEDFKTNDISIRLEESLAKYFREWDVEGSINVRTGILMTPYFPLRNILRGMEVGFDNNEVRIDSLKFVSGSSEIAVKGALSGLKRALLGRGTYGLDLDIRSDKMDADALLAAYYAGSEYVPESASAQMAEVSDAEFLKMVIADTLSTDDPAKLIVVPANLNASIRLDARNISFSGLEISNLSSDIVMKERCMQILNTSVSTNVGSGTFEGFYATRTKKDIRTGFNLGLNDITTEKVISMMPAVDTIMPLLKSFKGLVDCEFAATASLDTNMNVIMPSINGVIRISGENLSMSEDKVFTDLAKKLKFKDRKEGKIDNMTVEGLIEDNTIEVFPFILDIDRYTLALSGRHNLDQSFRYHASLIRSPMLFKVGVDLYGPNFDSMKFKIGKPKYKNTQVPVFTEVIDRTRLNLAESIKGIFEKGVEAAVRENEKHDFIAAHKKEIGYVNAVDQQMEELSDDEKKQLDDDK